MDTLSIFGLQLVEPSCVRSPGEVVRDTMARRETNPAGIDPADLPPCISAYREAPSTALKSIPPTSSEKDGKLAAVVWNAVECGGGEHKMSTTPTSRRY